jgi:TetR/AcrR family transcriptional regulator, cholesterol catabolism regulator
MNTTSETPRTQRQQQAAARREQLLAVALDLFAEKGIQGTTTRDIAQAAGITEGLIYHYFPSKTALLQAVVERYHLDPEVSRMIPALAGLPVREALVQLVTQFYELLQRNRKFVTMVFSQAHRDEELSDALASISGRGFQLVLEFVQERIERGELRPHDAMISLRVLHHSVIWYFFMGQMCGAPKMPPIEPERFLRGVVDTVLNGVIAEPEAPESWNPA